MNQKSLFDRKGNCFPPSPETGWKDMAKRGNILNIPDPPEFINFKFTVLDEMKTEILHICNRGENTAKKCEVRQNTIVKDTQYNTPEGALVISKDKGGKAMKKFWVRMTLEGDKVGKLGGDKSGDRTFH